MRLSKPETLQELDSEVVVLKFKLSTSKGIERTNLFDK